MPVFVERYVLPIFAAAAFTICIMNALKLDWMQRITLFVGVSALALFAGHTISKRKVAAQAPPTNPPTTAPNAPAAAAPPLQVVAPPAPTPPKATTDSLAYPHRSGKPTMSEDDKRTHISQHNTGAAIQAGRDVVVHGNVSITNNTTAGRPTDAELRADITITRVTNVQFKGPPMGYPHHAAVSIAALKYDHPEAYVRITATADLGDRFLFQRPNRPNSFDTMQAMAVRGRTLEITQGSPGIVPGKPWMICVFSQHPFDIAEVVWEDRNPFTEVSARLAPTTTP